MALVLGLGNPGPRYARTRHNAGWRVVEILTGRWQARPFETTGEYRAWRAEVGGRGVDLALPLTFMNLSGRVLEAWRERHGLDPAALLVVTDDVYLPVGTLRLRASGSSGGHNGLESVEAALGTREYARLRIGVGEAPAAELGDHVLEAPPGEEADTFEEALERAADAAQCWLEEGVLQAMNRFNRKTGKEESDT